MTKAIPVRDRLVGSAITLLRTKGADGFGISELLADSAVARRSMYQHFPEGKAQLLTAAVVSAGRHLDAQLDALLTAHPPVEALALWIENWKQGLIASDFQRGCPLAAAAQSDDEYPGAARAAGDVLRGFAERITAAFIADGLAPEAAQTAGTVLVSAIEGAILTARSRRDPAPLDDVVAHARAVWGQAVR